MTVALIYPHQLFSDSPAVEEKPDRIVLVEDPRFFSDFAVHIQKLLLHRLSMRRYGESLRDRGHRVSVVGSGEIDASHKICQVAGIGPDDEVLICDPVDESLLSALRRACESAGAELSVLRTPMLLTDRQALAAHFDESATPYMARFYRGQRKAQGVLIDSDGGPVGGTWSFDPENRKKLPKGHSPPEPWAPPKPDDFDAVARSLRQEFPDAPGQAEGYRWPLDRDEALRSLSDFVENRLALFGDYEDAVDPDHDFIYHSLLSPALNIGLLTPAEVVDTVVSAWQEDPERLPLNSVEGFVRQVMGWREFMAGAYRYLGSDMRSRNFFEHTRAMPNALYDGSTGIDPVDSTVGKVLHTGYAHHIERLMILGNFMVLTEIDPGEVYRWFMELFIDAYDWVMVPNVYGMSQYSDGGLITTKPYISSSNYLRKMTRYAGGPWCDVWDGLYWRFIEKHRGVFESNPRMSMMTKLLDRMERDTLERHRNTAVDFLARLHRAEPAAFR